MSTTRKLIIMAIAALLFTVPVLADRAAEARQQAQMKVQAKLLEIQLQVTLKGYEQTLTDLMDVERKMRFPREGKDEDVKKRAEADAQLVDALHRYSNELRHRALDLSKDIAEVTVGLDAAEDRNK